MPSRGETWIKTTTGWRTTRTIIIVNKRPPESPISSDSEDDIGRNKNACGVYWQSTAPFVVLPGERNTLFYFVSQENATESVVGPTIATVFRRLHFQQSIKNLRRFNYTTNLVSTVLNQDLMLKKKGPQKYILRFFDRLVHHVLSSEENFQTAKDMLTDFKKSHTRAKGSFDSMRFWNSISQQINYLETKLVNRKMKKQRRNDQDMRLLDLPVDVIRLILRCLEHHRDVCNMGMVNRYLYKLSEEQGLWKSLCLYHLPKSKIQNVDVNIANSWKDRYRAKTKCSTLRQSFSDVLLICSRCQFIWWKHSKHQCTFNGVKKAPLHITITPRGFIHLFEKW